MMVTSESLAPPPAERPEVGNALAWLAGSWRVTAPEMSESDRPMVTIRNPESLSFEVAFGIPDEQEGPVLWMTGSAIRMDGDAVWIELKYDRVLPELREDFEAGIGPGRYLHVRVSAGADRDGDGVADEGELQIVAGEQAAAWLSSNVLVGAQQGDEIFVPITSPAADVIAAIDAAGADAWTAPMPLERVEPERPDAGGEDPPDGDGARDAVPETPSEERDAGTEAEDAAGP